VTRSHIARWLTAFGAVVAALALAALPSIAQQEPSGPESGASATAELTDVSAAAMEPGGTIRLSGHVVNTSEQPLTDVQALVRFSRNPLTDPEEIARVPLDPELHRGLRSDIAIDEATDTLEPGEVVPFELEIEVDELGLNPNLPGLYAIGADVRASEQEGARSTVASSRTVVPFLPAPDQLTTLDVAFVWPLTHPPSILADGTFADDSLAAELSQGGSLHTRVSAAADTPVTWAIDPDLLITTEIMAQGYQVRSGDLTQPQTTEIQEGTGTEAAQQWRTLTEQATSGDDVVALPAATPDLVAMQDREFADDVLANSIEQARTALAEDPILEGGRLAWLADATDTSASLAGWAAAGVDSVVLPGDELDEAPEDLRTVRSDARLSDVLADAADAPPQNAADGAGGSQVSGFQAQQRWRAETALVALEGTTTDTGTSLVVAPPSGWDPDADVAEALLEAWQQTPWTSPVPLAEVEGSAANQTTGQVATEPSPTSAQQPLPAENVDAAEELAAGARLYGSLVADGPSSTPQAAAQSPVRATSTSWRSDPQSGLASARFGLDVVQAPAGNVTVEVPDRVTLSSDTGRLPLTVENELDTPVAVRVEARAANPDRLTLQQTETLQVEAGESRSVEVEATARSNGRVPVRVRLVSPDGMVIGEPQQMIVTATEYSTIGWVIIGVGGAMFAGLLGLRVLRERRNKHTRTS